ncbi:unnamed protein product [Anisakis simplex]|uniref:Transmembrane protein n=1 Tax=Anisakis simplex TaxID=6269 RepID=A0A0M3K6H6_ANISI|nr:unnamed protein product [Anisakis simplex]
MTTQKTVVIPRSKEERDKIKEGFIEDNNDAIAYLDFPLLVPSAVVTVFSVVILVCAIVLSIWFDQERLRNHTLTPWLNVFGWAGTACINATASDIPKHWMPSVLRLFELNVLGNVLFRIVTVIPIAIRLFNSFITQSNNTLQQANDNPLYHFCNTVTPYLLFAELFSCALFSIITIRQDFPGISAFSCAQCLFLFIDIKNGDCSPIVRSLVSFQRIDHFSSIVKAISLVGFAFTAPYFLTLQQQFIDFPSCHPYAQESHYCLCRFVCYPRTASGECEPVKPSNFGIGGPFEHCRSWELAQRQSEFTFKPVDRSKIS